MKTKRHRINVAYMRLLAAIFRKSLNIAIPTKTLEQWQAMPINDWLALSREAELQRVFAHSAGGLAADQD